MKKNLKKLTVQKLPSENKGGKLFEPKKGGKQRSKPVEPKTNKKTSYVFKVFTTYPN